MSITNVGIIGGGRIGKVHAQTIAYKVPGASVKILADIFMNEELESWCKDNEVKQTTKDYEEILKDDEIEAVLICSSTDTHAQMIIDSARAGKHIFCEKPLDLDMNKIKKVLDIVDKSNVKLQVGFMRRFDRHHRKVFQSIKEGAIGSPYLLKITSRDPAPPPIDYVKVSGGIFLDSSIHDYDMARFLIGSEIETVYATGSCLVDPEIGKVGDVDTAATVLTFENGVIGVIDNSRKSGYGHDQRIEVLGSMGCVRDENDTPSNVMLMNDKGLTTEQPYYFFLERYSDAYALEIVQFIEAIKGKGKIPCDGKDALISVAIGLAATDSYRKGTPTKVRDYL